MQPIADKKVASPMIPLQKIESELSEENKDVKSDDKIEKAMPSQQQTYTYKPIFNPNQSTIDNLKNARSSNNISPSFGDQTSKNADKTPSAKDAKANLFKPKADPIPEDKNEDEQDEKKPETTKKISLFNKTADDKPKSIFLKQHK